MRFKILTIFPNCFPGLLSFGKIGKALQKKIFELDIVDLKNFAIKKMIDDRPYGGSAGMVLCPLVLEQTLSNKDVNIFLSPRGAPINQKILENLSKEKSLTILCGRYEGVDQRIIDYYNMQEFSLGDFILCGGEVAAQALIEGVTRLLPGVLNNEESIVNESFSVSLLEHDHFTRPNTWNGLKVPEVLLSGNHKEVDKWRFLNSCEKTIKNRPDLWRYFCFVVIFTFYYINWIIPKRKKNRS